MLLADEKIEIGVNADDDGVPEIGGETSGADEIEGKLFGDGGGKGSDDFFDGGFGEDGNVATGSKLLKGLEESSGLAEGVVGAEVGLDPSVEDVHDCK
nr:hypothetical protein CFP56_19075 [Quercus suber]